MHRTIKIEKTGIFFLGACIFIILLLSIKGFSVRWKNIGTSENKEIVLQNKENNCGPVTLKMIFDHYKIPSTLDEIESNIKVTQRGTSMLALKEMSELKGLHAEGWRLTVNDLLKTAFPIILFVNGNHYVVADSVIRDTLFIRDPTIGQLSLNINNLSGRWNGESLIFKKQNGGRSL
jgi:ABC-type bacteriocin/lantibiotic exporter with double-glycine peptidase domain